MKHAIVTGGCGFVGSHLVRALVADGVRVTVLDDLSSGSTANAAPNVTCIHCDVSEPWPKLEKFDVCFHLAAVSRIGWGAENPDRTLAVNRGGTLKALLRAQTFGAKLVLASSCTAARPGLNAYATSKRQAEHVCAIHAETFGPRSAAVARLFNVYGPGEPAGGKTGTLVARARRAAALGEPLEVRGTGDQVRDFVHVEDAVAALRLLATAATTAEPYDVGTGVGTSVLEVAEAAGAEIRPAPLPHPEMEQAVADPARMAGLGWAPRHSVRDWLKTPAEAAP